VVVRKQHQKLIQVRLTIYLDNIIILEIIVIQMLHIYLFDRVSLFFFFFFFFFAFFFFCGRLLFWFFSFTKKMGVI
jgi:hypothetical protein